MRVAVLGPLEVDESTDRLTPRDRVILSALVLWSDEVVSAGRLADALWRDEPPETWPKVVQGCIVRLRKVLGSQAIETAPHGYRLALPSDEVDARRFERLVGRGRELLALGEPERAGWVLGEAIALWRGPAFGDLDGWETGRAERDRLQELRRDVEEMRVDAALRAGQAGEVVAAAQALVSQAPLRERRWALLALAQYQAGRQAEALHTIREVRRVLAVELGLDPGPELVALEQAILQQDPTLVVDTALPEPSQTCPYPGLVPYDVADGDGFFGRDREVAQCLRRLAEQGVLVVVGPSGSGKSSLVRAGVAAALARDGRRSTVVAPGPHPMDAITALPATGRRPVLLVDQCEEAVTQCRDAAERAEFFKALADHAEKAPLVVALRADHMSDLAAYPAFARVVERGLYLLGDMDAEGLRACIQEPAGQAGLLLEPGLVDLLVREVEGEPGALPLLAHALRQTWARREGRTLTVSGYVDTGGIRGAVARTADELWSTMDPEQQRVTRDLMLRLVATGASGEPVRHRLPRRLLAVDGEHGQVVERLVTARLVTSDEGSLQVAHEALARAWPRLQDWLAEDAQGQQIRHHLSAAADAWDRLERPDSELYRGVRLAQAVDWRDRSHPELTPVERDFLDASQLQVDSELRAAEQRAEQEATARRRTRRLATGLATVLVLALVAVGLATYFQREATARADEASVASTEADANRLAQLSGTVDDLDTSLLLAVEAFNTADTPATRDGLFGTLLEHRRAEQVMPLNGNVTATALTDDGARLYVGLRDHVAAWQVGTASPPARLVDTPVETSLLGASRAGLFALNDPTANQPTVRVLAADGSEVLDLRGVGQVGGWPWHGELTPDGRLLRLVVATEGEGGAGVSVSTIEVATGLVDRLDLFELGEDEWFDAELAADGSTLVVWKEAPERAAYLVRFPAGSVTRLPSSGSSVAQPLGHWPLANGAAQARDDGSIALFDNRGREIQVLEVHQSPVLAVAMTPDATWAASADTQGLIQLWDVDPASGRWSVRETLTGHEGPVQGLVIEPSGGRLISVADDGSLISWDTSRQAGFGTPYGDGFDARWVSNRPAVVVPGELVAAPTRDDRDHVSATFVDPRTGEVVDRVPIGPAVGQIFGSSVSVRPGGTHVAVTHGAGTVVIDARTRDEVARIDLRPRGDDFETELVWDSTWTPDGSRLLIGAEGSAYSGDDGGLAVVDPATWEVVRRVSPGRAPQVMEFSPDGTQLAIGSETGQVTPPEVLVLDGTTYDVEQVVALPEGAFPFDLSFSPDGTRLAVVGDGGTLTVHETRTWTPLHGSVKVHDGYGRQVEWLAGGETVVTSGSDGTVSLYDVSRDLVRVHGIPGSATGRSGQTHIFPPLGDEIVVSTEDGPGRRYPMDVAAWIDYACAVAGRDLTEAEWNRYAPTREYRRTCSDR